MSKICDDLRAAILQAAMQGKLTEQLPEDGNAKELLSQIKDKKAKLNIKKKELVISENEILFEIPNNWSWEKLENISQFLGDKNNQIKESATLNDGKYKVVSQSKELYIGYCNDEKRVLRIADPVLVFGDHTALVKYIDFDFIIGADGVKVISPFCIDIKYLYYALKYNLIGVNELGGYSRHYKFIKDKLIPIPPLAEQKRIVKKVDKLMACVADLEESADALALLKKAFPDDIKASLLQYTMQGKLTKQLPEDGNAGDLQEKIKAEKEKLIAGGKIKKQKPLTPITDDEVPFSIPENWKWVRMDSIFNIHSSIRIHQSDWKTSGIPFFRGRELVKLAKNGDVDPEIFISKELYEENKRKGGVPQKDDILVSAVGTIGKAYIVKGNRSFYYKDAYVLCFDNIGNIIPQFIKYAIEAPCINDVIMRGSMGTTVAQLTIDKAKNLLLPLPPIPEQKRIVERLDAILQNINAVGELIASE